MAHGDIIRRCTGLGWVFPRFCVCVKPDKIMESELLWTRNKWPGFPGMSSHEPRNPLYFLLLIVSLVFVVTALAYAVVPELERKAAEAGQTPPPSGWRDALRRDGWQWLLYQVAAMIVLGVLSMGLDRLRRLKKERAGGTMAQPSEPPAP
jgi:hypothetical protein